MKCWICGQPIQWPERWCLQNGKDMHSDCYEANRLTMCDLSEPAYSAISEEVGE